MNRVLVTGGSGYFGSVLVHCLHSLGVKVVVFDTSDAIDRPQNVEFIQGDIRDLPAVQRACQGVDVVLHSVALVPLAKDVRAFWSVNHDGTKNLLQAALEKGVSKVIHISSSAVFGIPRKNPVDDNTTPEPGEEYGRAKFAAEKLCHQYADMGLDATIVRPRTIMGPGRLGIMQVIFEWVRQGRNVPVLGKGDNLYQFIHADDLAGACIKAAKKKGPATYNIGAQDFCSMRQTLEGLIAHASTKSKVVSLPKALAEPLMKLTGRIGMSPLGPYHSLMYGRSMYFDITRPQQELDWVPEYGNVEMFCHSYDWYLENREDVLRIQGASHHRSPVKQGVLKAVGWFLELV